MAARGSLAKQEVLEKILETFDGSFKFDKELRIPMEENGETVEIKVTLTCAKTNVGGSDAVKAEATGNANPTPMDSAPTEEEKQRVSDLLSKLGM